MQQQSDTLCANCSVQLEHIELAHATAAAQHKQRIEELENQVRFLTDKASAAADKLADYEDVFRQQGRPVSPSKSRKVQPSHDVLIASFDNPMPHNSIDGEEDDKALPPLPSNNPNSTTDDNSATANGLLRRQTVSHRFASFLNARRGVPAATPAVTSPASTQPLTLPPLNRSDSAPPAANPTEHDTAALLLRETILRQAAEASLAKVHAEMEELSASLFEQANGMVSDERRARAAAEQAKTDAEERASQMEGRLKMLEGRDSRMDMLEEAVRRVGRVRHVLGVGDAHRASMGATLLPALEG